MGAWYHLFLRILAGWLLLKNLALRHQLAVLNRNAAKPKFHDSDRLLWVDLRAVWSRWEKALVIIQPPNGDRLASRRVSPLLAMEIASGRRKAADRP